MIVNEVSNSLGQVIERETINLDTGRYQLEVDSGAGLVVVEERALTTAETARATHRENHRAVHERINNGSASGRTFLNVANPSLPQVTAQVRVLTQQLLDMQRRFDDDFTDIADEQGRPSRK